MNADGLAPDRRESFEGFRRPDGRLGVRNRILVLPSVICSHVVCDEIADREPSAVSAPHDHGCGQLGADSDQTKRTLVALAGNPNVAGTVVVGLGCEKVRSDDVADEVAERGLPVRELTIQETGGTEPCIERGVEAVGELADEAAAATADAATLGDLTVGVVVDDLSTSTREHAHPLVAGLTERVTAAGGRVVVAGSERFAAHPDETRKLVGEDTATNADAVERLLARGGRPARATRIGSEAATLGFEDATGFLGDAPVSGVAAYGETATADGGVTLLNAPSRFAEAATGLAAAGAQVVIHVTGQGIPAGHPLVPVLKLSGDADTLAAVPDDVDVDARETAVDELVERLRAVADGRRVSAEAHGLTEFAITRVGPSI